MSSRRVIEIASSGVDEYLQGLSGDPYNGSSAVGLRVPALATPNAQSRYLFLGSVFSIGEGVKARIRGYRQLVTLGKDVTGEGGTPRFVEQPVTTPTFRLQDGNWSFHLHRLGPPNAQGWPQVANPADNLRSFMFHWADGPALLYQNYTIDAGQAYYTKLTAYTPPNNGRPWGTALRSGQQGTFTDLRTPWLTHGAWHSLDEEFYGPDTIAMFISVRQTAGAEPPSGVTLSDLPNSMPEEQFIAAFPGCLIWRVGCSMIVEMEP
jgi:hypothetical protein